MATENRTPESPIVPDENFILAESADAMAQEYRLRLGPDKSPQPTGPMFRDDFVLASIEDDEDEGIVYLAPPEGVSPAERRLICMEPIRLTEEEEPERPLTQFTLWEMMVLTSFLSVGLAIMYYLPPSQVAGVLGILALVGQALLMRFPPENRHVKLGAWVLLAMYAVAAGAAFCQHIFGWGNP